MVTLSRDAKSNWQAINVDMHSFPLLQAWSHFWRLQTHLLGHVQISVPGRDAKKSCGHWQSHCCYREGPFRSSADSVSADAVDSRHEIPRHLLNRLGIACIGCIGLSLNLRGKFSMLSIWHPYGLIPVGNWTLLQLFISHLNSSTSPADYSLPWRSAAYKREAALGAAVARIIDTLKTLKRSLRRQRVFRRLWTAGSFLQTDEAEELRQVVSTANLRRELWAFIALFLHDRTEYQPWNVGICRDMSGYVGICRDMSGPNTKLGLLLVCSRLSLPLAGQNTEHGSVPEIKSFAVEDRCPWGTLDSWYCTWKVWNNANHCGWVFLLRTHWHGLEYTHTHRAPNEMIFSFATIGSCQSLFGPLNGLLSRWAFWVYGSFLRSHHESCRIFQKLNGLYTFRFNMVHRGTTNAHAALHQDVTGFRTGTPLQHCWLGRCRRAAASSGFCRDLGSTYYNILNQPPGDLGDILVYCDVMTMMLLEVSRLRCCIEGVQHVQLFPHFLHSLRSMRDSMEEATPRTCSLLVLIPSHGAAWGPIVAQENP